ncbi:efflux RND transporter permease subunit [Belliella pelovolcani]|nr:efflux RND transporter permease subunit [Belliella pelovolcani]
MFDRKKSMLGLGLAALISVLFVILQPQVKFDYDFEQFFPQDDEELRFYQEFRTTFGNDNDYLLIALGQERGVFDQEFLDEALAIQDKIQALDLVEAVFSLLELEEPIIGALGVSYRNALDWSSDQKLEQSKKRLLSHPQYAGNLISQDGDYLLLMVSNKQRISKEEGDVLNLAIKEILSDSEIPLFYTAGKIKAQGEFVDLLQAEFGFFLAISFVLILLLLFLIFRTWWGVLLPVIVLSVGIGWTIALILLTGKALDVMSVMQPTILLVIGLSALVHLLSYYLKYLGNGVEKSKAIALTFKELFLAVFLTCFTTALGFSTMYFTSAVSLKQFGLYTALGVMVMFLAVLLITPGLLHLFSPLKAAENDRFKEFWRVYLGDALRWTWGNRKLVLSVFSILTIFSIFALSDLKINGYLLDNLPRDHELVQEFEFFDREFGGSKPLEIFLEAGEEVEDVFDLEFLRALDKVEHFVTEHYESGVIISPLSLVKALNQAQNGGNPKAYDLPSRGQYQRIQPYLDQALLQSNFKLSDSTKRIGRLSTRTADMGSHRSFEIKRDLETFVKQEVDPEILKIQLTGTSNLIDKSHETISTQMARGLGVAIILVGIIAGFLFRSWRISLMVLNPNVLPLLWMCGVMWLLDIELKLTTAVIFTVAFGIAVDDSIHFMTKLYNELGKGKRLLYALKRTYMETGKAIILTTIILVSGFAILTLSEFGVTFYAGLLISLALFFALIADLLLLPILLLPMDKVWREKRRRKNA